MQAVRVLVVDDSAFMRRAVIDLITKDPLLAVAGYARDGLDALEKVTRLQPDVVTLDVEMPALNGLETLKRLMNQHPLPVIMLSSVTVAGAEATLKALEAGAVDFVTKPANPGEMDRLGQELREKIKIAAGVKVARLNHVAKTTPMLPSTFPGQSPYGLIAMAASTGGPAALQQVLQSLPGNLPVPVVVVQHMPVGFTGPLAQRLNRHSELLVSQAGDGEELSGGKVLVVPAGWQPRFVADRTKVRLRLDPAESFSSRFAPSADALFLAAAEVYGAGSLGVILTGMGNDGTRGLLEVKRRGGRVLGEAEQSCVVFGMPKAALEAGAVDLLVPIGQMGSQILKELHPG